MNKNLRGQEKSMFTRIGKNDFFAKRFHELLSSDVGDWTNKEKEYILSCAVLFCHN